MAYQLEGFLNLLGEAERAGGRILHELTEQATSLERREMLKKGGHDEGYYAGELAAHVRRLGGTPSTKTGDSVEKVRGRRFSRPTRSTEPRAALGDPQDRGERSCC